MLPRALPGPWRAYRLERCGGVLLLCLLWGGGGAYGNTTAADNPMPARGDSTIRQSAGYIGTPDAPLARIFHALVEHLQLVAGDQALIDAGADKHLQIGDRLTVFRPTTAVRHPLTAQPLGAIVATLGTAKVLSIQSATATIQIMQAFDSINVGDHVKVATTAPATEPTAALPSRDQTLTGVIAATKDERVVVGPGDIVYLDRGAQHGVNPGDRFDVLQESRTTRQVLGTLSVLEVRSRTSTAVITAGQREFSIGMPVERSSASQGTPSAAELQTGAALAAQVDAALTQLPPCLEAARQAIRAAEAAGMTSASLAEAQTALARAEGLFNSAEQAVARGDYEQAIRLLETAQKDCLTAQEMTTSTGGRVAERTLTTPEQYRVQRGDTLWGISAKPMIYANPLMWPLIYQANRQRIHDPDLITPRQLLAIPRDFSAEQARVAIQRARQRGPWRLHDGPDPAMLEGLRH